jgi:hypothetical protein
MRSGIRRLAMGAMVAVALAYGTPQQADAQSFNCWATGTACCVCGQDWSGWLWCYDTAISGWQTCFSSFTYCELEGFCWATALGSLAPDGGVFSQPFARTLYGVDELDGPSDTTSSNGLVDVPHVYGGTRVVGCGNVIAERRYAREVVADMRRRLEVMTL